MVSDDRIERPAFAPQSRCSTAELIGELPYRSLCAVCQAVIFTTNPSLAPASVPSYIPAMALDRFRRWLNQPVLKELALMSGTEAQLQTDLTAQTAAITALATEIQTGLAANASDIAALKAQIAAGTPVTATDLTALETNTTAVQTATSTLQAALNPPAPPPAA